MLGERAKKILVVDDEPDIIVYFTILLEGEGYAVFSASSAGEALETARSEIPDLICLDIMMPKRSGLACYKEIRTDPALRNIPVMIVSAFGQPKDFKGERFRKIISDDQIPEPECFVEKPIKPQDFVASINAIIGPSDAEEVP